MGPEESGREFRWQAVVVTETGRVQEANHKVTHKRMLVFYETWNQEDIMKTQDQDGTQKSLNQEGTQKSLGQEDTRKTKDQERTRKNGDHVRTLKT